MTQNNMVQLHTEYDREEQARNQKVRSVGIKK
jgi:hypothetical protein